MATPARQRSNPPPTRRLPLRSYRRRRPSRTIAIRPMPMKPSLFDAPAELAPPEPATPRTCIPPPPERVAPRAPRMPRIDELPLPAQNEIRAQRGELAEDHPEKRRMSLMQRLASVGLGRRGEQSPRRRRPRTRRNRCRSRCRNSSGRSVRARASRKAVRPRRSRNMRAGRPRRVWTPTAGQLLCITRPRMTSWTFRRSCAVRRTDRLRKTGKGPVPPLERGLFHAGMA